MLPLSDIKVVDMAQVYLGPSAAALLGDQGAEVIKVEPLEGDSNRNIGVTPYLEQHSFSRPFLSLNRNKRGIAIDIASVEGQEIVHSLARWSDVFITNFRPGAEARVRMDYETLANINPRLIYVAISAFGREGPDANLPGYDVVIQARSGVLSTRRNPDGTPVPSRIMVADIPGSQCMAYAIMVALWERQKTGKGQRIDMALLHSALFSQVEQLMWVDNDSAPISRQQRGALSAPYECGDGKWLIIAVLQPHQWRRLCRALELEHLADDPRFATASKRAEMAGDLIELLAAIFKSRPSDYWLERLYAESVPCAPVLEQGEVDKDPQTIANHMFWEDVHPVIGPYKIVAPPFQLSNTKDETRLRRPSPTVGQHTKEVLTEFGYDKDTLAGLYQRGVIK